MSLPTPKRVPTRGFYYHYKHDPEGSIENYAYEVVAVGFHTEDDPRPGEAHFVNYRPLYASAAVYALSRSLGIQCQDNRPLEMWMGDVEKDGKTFPRFQKITDPAVITALEVIRDRMYP